MRKTLIIILVTATTGILAHLCFRKQSWYQNSVSRVLDWFRKVPARVGGWFSRDKSDPTPSVPSQEALELAQANALCDKLDAIMTKAEKMEPGARDAMFAKFAEDNNLE